MKNGKLKSSNRHPRTDQRERPDRLKQRFEPQGRVKNTSHGPDLVYGKNAVYEVIRAGKRKVYKILLSEGLEHFSETPLYKAIKSKNISCEQATRAELDRLTQGAIHQNVVAQVAPYPDYQLFEVFEETSTKKLVLVLDCVQDPQNFGTLCRSALAFGVREIVVPKDRASGITPVVCKASSGAVEHLKIIFVTNLARSLDEFKKHGFWVYGASLDARSQALNAVQPADKSAVVVGSEGHGLRRLVAESCDVLVKIPMAVDFDSLNVAQAGTVILYDFWGKMNFSS